MRSSGAFLDNDPPFATIIHMNVVLCFFILLFSSIYPLTTIADDNCIACHTSKGAKRFVDKIALEQSVHKGISCTNCHLNVSGYPHGPVGKVICGSCHFLGREGAPREEALEYKLSVHGEAVRLGKPGAPDCTTCHGSHAVYPSSDTRSQTFRMNIPALCSGCHMQEYNVYRRSVHGRQFLEKKNGAAANCFDCHLEHRVPAAADPAWKLALVRECGICHEQEYNTYRRTFHGKVTQLGYQTAAKCSDCHGSHAILAVSDEDSMLSPRNRLATCRACHPNATEGFTKYYAHAEELNRGKYPELYWTYAFMTALLIGVFSFFFLHTVLWAFRSLKERLGKGGR